jgi:hypothetical protein
MYSIYFTVHIVLYNMAVHGKQWMYIYNKQWGIVFDFMQRTSGTMWVWDMDWHKTAW